MFKVNNKATKTTRRFGGFVVNFEHISRLCSSVSIVNFEHVIADSVNYQSSEMVPEIFLESHIFFLLKIFLVLNN